MGRDILAANSLGVIDISIHSPRMGRDVTHRRIYDRIVISIHSPRMGRDRIGGVGLRGGFRFQSTLPAWGETSICANTHDAECISIHSPRMGRDRKRTQLFEEKNWRICTTLYLFASKGVLPADKKTF